MMRKAVAESNKLRALFLSIGFGGGAGSSLSQNDASSGVSHFNSTVNYLEQRYLKIPSNSRKDLHSIAVDVSPSKLEEATSHPEQTSDDADANGKNEACYNSSENNSIIEETHFLSPQPPHLSSHSTTAVRSSAEAFIFDSTSHSSIIQSRNSSSDSLFAQSCRNFNISINDFSSVIDNPPSHAEITGGFKALKANSNITKKVLPNGMQDLENSEMVSLLSDSQSHLEQFHDRLEDFLVEAFLYIDIEKEVETEAELLRLQHHEENQEQQQEQRKQDQPKKNDVETHLKPTAVSVTPKPTLGQWEELYQFYPCALCLDVLAAPHLLTACSHSFCWSCLEESFDSCHSPDATVIHHCPTCRVEITHCAYELTMDNEITRRVEEISTNNSCEKEHWIERKQKFQHFQKAKREGKLPDNEEAKGVNSPNSPRNEKWDHYCKLLLGLAVLGLVQLYRSHRP